MGQFGNYSGDDPLGIAVQGRAQQARQQYALGPGWGHPSGGPLPDPKWDGLFQAMGEQGVDRVAGGGVPEPGPFVGQKQLSGRNGAGEVGPQGFAPATGQLAMNGLNAAYKPNYGR